MSKTDMNITPRKAGVLIVTHHPDTPKLCVLLGLNRYSELDIFGGTCDNDELYASTAVRELREETYNKVRISQEDLTFLPSIVISSPGERKETSLKAWCLHKDISPEIFEDVKMKDLAKVSQEMRKMVYIPLPEFEKFMVLKNFAKSCVVKSVDDEYYYLAPRALRLVQVFGKKYFPREEPKKCIPQDGEWTVVKSRKARV